MMPLSAKHTYSKLLSDLSEEEPRELMKDDVSEFLGQEDREKPEQEIDIPEQIPEINDSERHNFDNEELQDNPKEETSEPPKDLTEDSTKVDEKDKADDETKDEPAPEVPEHLTADSAQIDEKNKQKIDEAKPEVSAQSSADTEQLKTQIDALKTDLEGLKKQFEDKKQQDSLKSQIEKLKKQVERIDIEDDADLNNSIINASKIKLAYRKLRRIKTAILDSNKECLIEMEYLTNSHLSKEELAHLINEKHKIDVQDVYQFLQNYDESYVSNKPF